MIPLFPVPLFLSNFAPTFALLRELCRATVGKVVS